MLSFLVHGYMFMRKVFNSFIFFLCPILFSSAQEVTMGLDECINYAVSHHPKVQVERENSVVADSERSQSYWAYFPTVDLSTDVSMTFNNSAKGESLTSIPKFNPLFGNVYALKLQMPLYSGGKLAYNSKASKRNVEISQLNVQLAREEVAEKTMIAYFETLYNSHVVTQRKKMVASYAYQTERLERMYDLGGSSISDLSQVRAALSKAELEVSKAMLEYDKSLIELKRVMNFPVGDALMIVQDIPIVAVSIDLKESNNEVKSYLDNNLHIRKLAKEVETKEDGLVVARQYNYPSIVLNGLVGSNFNSLLQKDSNEMFSIGHQLRNKLSYFVGVTISLPIFNGFRGKHEVVKAKSSLVISNHKLQEYRNNLEAIILQVQSELKALNTQSKLSENNLELTRTANASLMRKFEEGAISLFELQSSNNQLLEAELEYMYFQLNLQVKTRVLNYYKGQSYINK